ncbi:RluA family pseudouridine synthase [Candidatus Palauibacter sp.]|uniref:RluA family pseudouridine synthase n=1 Tax=Candidatus Palauibacter sp. TaxID=3101350 RepID=UPI003B5B685C
MSPPDSGPTDAGERRLIEVEEAVSDRLDRLLSERLALSRTRAARLIADGRVTVNDRVTRKRYLPRAGDRIEVELPPATPTRLEPEAIPVRIRYEDEHLAVVEKPAGLVVHPAPGHPRGTLVNALLFHLDRLSDIGGDRRPGIVHRLDRDTSGLMVVAKRDEAYRELSAGLRRREIERGYLAAAWGHLQEERFTVDRPIGRDRQHRKRMAIREDGRPAITHFKRLERWNAADLVAVRLGTGRTHQVRVHLRSVGHPVVADPVYAAGWERGFGGAGGRWAEAFGRRAGRLFLHAAKLAFSHPVTGERLSFSSSLPSPLLEAVEWARSTS